MTGAGMVTQAMVLSGGGAYGAYEVGVMKALFNGKSSATNGARLDPEIFSGASVGGFNAAFMVSQPQTDIATTVAQLEDVWLKTMAESAPNCGNGIYRFRANPDGFLQLNCAAAHPLTPISRLASDGLFFARELFKKSLNFLSSEGRLSFRTIRLVNLADFISVDPLHATVKSTIDLRGIQQSKKALRIAATNWNSGELQIFENQDLVDEVGDLIILASAAIPGIFPPVHIGGQIFIDGGVLLNTPLLPSIRAGADVVHAIYLDPDVSKIPLGHLEDTVDTLDRQSVIQWAAKANEDIETVRWVNQGLSVIENVARGQDMSATQLKDFIRFAGIFREREASGLLPYKKITVHRYHPDGDLGGSLGVLNFSHDQIAGLIERGFNDTVNHNCEESQCVIPE